MTDLIGEARALIKPLVGYSPGPWIRDVKNVVDGDHLVATISQQDWQHRPGGWAGLASVPVALEGDDEPDWAGMANSRLIAAAPALRDMVAALIAHMESGTNKG